MILFQDIVSNVQVMRTKDSGLGVDNIGVLRQPDTGEKSPDWIWDERDGWDRGNSLSAEEKTSIVGMLDKLNNFGYRLICTKLARWREIVGQPYATL